MIDSELKYTSENVSEFVKYNIFGKNKASKVYVICYLVAMGLIAAVGVVLAVVTQLHICNRDLRTAHSCNSAYTFGDA